MLVARRVRAWLEPVLYEIVVLQRVFPQNYFRDPDVSFVYDYPYLPAGQQRHHVKHLLIDERPSAKPGWEGFVPDCVNIQDLAVLSAGELPFTALADLTSIIYSPLRSVSSRGLLRLTIHFSDLFPEGPIDFNHDIFKDLTHLRVMNFLYDSSE
ncbi:hypothetical protein AX16_005107 [Volvariella volvacea WC 439]|nr:hypothetical protein AX16_005107 [Volvariella volvacea WC 439]